MASRVAAPFRDSAARGRDFATRGSGGAAAASSPAAESAAAPAWAQRLRSEQNARHRRHMAMQTVRDGDRPGSGANPDLSDKEESSMFFTRSIQRYGQTHETENPYQPAGQLRDASIGPQTEARR